MQTFNPFAPQNSNNIQNNMNNSQNNNISQHLVQTQSQRTSALISNLFSILVQNNIRIRNRNRFSLRSVSPDFIKIGKNTNDQLVKELTQVLFKEEEETVEEEEEEESVVECVSDKVAGSLYFATSTPGSTLTTLVNDCQTLTDPDDYSGSSTSSTSEANDIVLTDLNRTFLFCSVGF